jgi:hypothetical protein
VKPSAQKKQRQPNEMNKENLHQCGTNKVYDEISAQKLCAGMMSMSVSRHAGREGFTLQHHSISMRKDNGAT